MKMTHTRIPLTILSLTSACGLALAIHAGSKSVATVASKATGGSSSWHWQNPLPQGNNLRGASFVDADTGTVVGEYGTIVRTTDGGNSWAPQSSGTSNDLFGVSFIDTNTGTAVGGACGIGGESTFSRQLMAETHGFLSQTQERCVSSKFRLPMPTPAPPSAMEA